MSIVKPGIITESAKPSLFKFSFVCKYNGPSPKTINFASTDFLNILKAFNKSAWFFWDTNRPIDNILNEQSLQKSGISFTISLLNP